MASLLLEPSPVAPAILDAVRDAIEKTYEKVSGSKPRPDDCDTSVRDCECVAGIISFFGDVSLSVAWVLTAESGPPIAAQFAKFPIPFNSADMGDVTGELVNVLAGDIILFLEKSRRKVKMSLPTVARGSRLCLMAERGASVSHLCYNTPHGKFWLRVATAVGSES